MRFLLSLVIAACLLTLYACTACSKKIDCPGFNDAQLSEWFPYVDHQQLIFQNNLNERDTFTLQNTETTAPYQTMTGGFNPNRGCYADKRFESYEKNQNKTSRFYINLSTSSYNDTVRMREASFTIDSDYVSMYNLQDTGFQTINILGLNMAQQHFPILQLGGHTFSNVLVATRDTMQNKQSGIYQIYAAPNTGLIAYSRYPSLITWVKQ